MVGRYHTPRVSLFALQKKTNRLSFPIFLSHTSGKPNINRLFSSSIKKLSFTDRPSELQLPDKYKNINVLN